MPTDLTDEPTYDALRISQWLTGLADGRGLSRRHLLRATAAATGAAGIGAVAGITLGTVRGADPAVAAGVPGPIQKPLPADKFYVYGSNAETRWEALAGTGYLTPNDLFFVRDHTLTPTIDADSWRLRLFGTGLASEPTADAPVEFSYQQLRRLPAETVTAFVECAGNGRSFFTSQQGETVGGTAWKLGAVGVARWRGVRLSTVLRAAGLRADAVDVMPEGLDPEVVFNGANVGHVRRPMPVRKALKDVLLAYEMNGEPLPADHGFPVRVVVPSWIGIANIKWVGRIEVSRTPLFSSWNTQQYRLFGPDYPADGTLITRQVIKSAFELPWDGTLAAGRTHVLRGRSWSGNGAVRRVEVSTDGATWRPAAPVGTSATHGWQRWELRWRPPAAGRFLLRARATDVTGASQPDQATFNTSGYLFDAVVEHPVTIA
jgi:DMSO/TMAO reductase YedYZ molybdopterin-dependent catalytic subunit